MRQLLVSCWRSIRTKRKTARPQKGGKQSHKHKNIELAHLVAAHVTRGELQEGGPIRGVGVAALVLTECQVPRNQGRSDWRHVRSAESFLAEKSCERVPRPPQP